MGKVHLTEAAVERYRRPLKNRIEVSDTEPGLFLWIRPSGTKSWMAIFRLPAADGKRTARRKIVLGRYPAMGVAAARAAAREVMTLAAQGIDPEVKAAEARAAEQEAAASRQASSFRTVADEYFAAMAAGKLIGGRKRPVTKPTASIREGESRNFNTYCPPSICAQKGNLSQWYDYLGYMFSIAQDRLESERWIATLIGRPDIRIAYSLLLISMIQGKGKSTLLDNVLRPLVGMSNSALVSAKSMDSAFNGWAAGKRLAVCHEIYEAGNWRLADHCGSAWKKDPGSGVIGVEKGPLIPVV